MKLEPGQVISGTLRLVKQIAEGGMGSVWIAEHLVLGRSVAVKLMSKQWAAMPSARTRFLREAKITAMLESPHVVRVLDCRLDEADEPYLVLELLHGENLEQRVRRTGPLSIYEVEEIVMQAASALSEAHGSAIVHRDVKPENVFLVEAPAMFVKLLDFGVAKPKSLEECLDVDLLPAGTPQYMSPEHMFEPETTDERSDLFSLAAVAYFALTGRSPFAAESLEALYFAIEGAKFARPSELRAELPEAVDAWFERALARDREKRFATAHEMARALHEAVLAGASSARIVVPAAREDDDDSTPITKSVPGLPKRRVGRSLAVFAAAAAAAGVWAWHSSGEVKPAVASTTTITDARLDAPALSKPTPVSNDAPVPANPAKRKPAAVKPTPAKSPPAKAPPPKAKAVFAPAPAPSPAPVAPPPTVEEDSLDPDRITSSIRDLIGNEPKVDVEP